MKVWNGCLFKIGKLCVLVSAWGFIVGEAYAASLLFDNISNSYSSCFFKDNGDGTSTVSTVVGYKTATGHTGGAGYSSRGALLYGYDKNGKPLPNVIVPYITLNGVRSNSLYQGTGYYQYQYVNGYPGSSGDWQRVGGFSATFTAVISNSNLSAWPAVSIRASNNVILPGRDVAEIKGAAYIARGESNGGSCKVINPEAPPPLDISISVSAPDWNLGDLQQGKSDITFSRTDQRLCFSHSAADVQSKKFIISASNARGVMNNKYRLVHLSDTSQTIPYSLTLDNGGIPLQLPGNQTEILLNGSVSCFVPTFHTEVGKTVKEGDYNDVLTFTVITKS